MITPSIITTLFIHFIEEGWEKVLFELGSERVKDVLQLRATRSICDMTVWFLFFFFGGGGGGGGRRGEEGGVFHAISYT